MAKEHYIAMAGLHGCLPASCHAHDEYEDAVESLADLHELTEEEENVALN